jgi:hypothetical protein
MSSKRNSAARSGVGAEAQPDFANFGAGAQWSPSQPAPHADCPPATQAPWPSQNEPIVATDWLQNVGPQGVLAAGN